jgi:hypothetical protein
VVVCGGEVGADHEHLRRDAVRHRQHVEQILTSYLDGRVGADESTIEIEQFAPQGE